MLSENRAERNQMEMFCIDSFLPEDHLLRKIVFIQHLYGIPSLHRTCEEIKMNVAYRWFLGYLMNE
ncbi:MAG: transposase, partial [Acutalibacteraceae bacterium]|nr:transposase [Acutalibacteraceae bacterium]